MSYTVALHTVLHACTLSQDQHVVLLQRLNNPGLQMNDALRNKALLDVDLKLQKMGKAGLSAWKQMPQPTAVANPMSQLEAAERSFNKAAMETQLEEQLPMLEANPEQAAAYAAIKDAIDGNVAQDVCSLSLSISVGTTKCSVAVVKLTKFTVAVAKRVHLMILWLTSNMFLILRCCGCCCVASLLFVA